MTATLVSVVGTRPQFVKAAPLSRALRTRYREVLVHTGQHYDPGLSDTFFRELGIPEPDRNLAIGSCSHGTQVARMRVAIREVLRAEAPAAVVVYGDTNSTLAGALAGADSGIPVAHVEAGLRSFNLDMPEEVNRIAVDHLSAVGLCPTPAAVAELAREGMGDRARFVGDVMLDACLEASGRAGDGILAALGVTSGEFGFATLHRAGNTDRPGRLRAILRALGRIGGPIVFPVHPRTAEAIAAEGEALPANVIRVLPCSYLETIGLVKNARLVLTDSGGLQKEAYFLGTPCVTLRDETEWPETLAGGWNVLAGADGEAIERAASRPAPPEAGRDLASFGGGRACARILDVLASMSI